MTWRKQEEHNLGENDESDFLKYQAWDICGAFQEKISKHAFEYMGLELRKEYPG